MKSRIFRASSASVLPAAAGKTYEGWITESFQGTPVGRRYLVVEFSPSERTCNLWTQSVMTDSVVGSPTAGLPTGELSRPVGDFDVSYSTDERGKYWVVSTRILPLELELKGLSTDETSLEVSGFRSGGYGVLGRVHLTAKAKAQ